MAEPNFSEDDLRYREACISRTLNHATEEGAWPAIVEDIMKYLRDSQYGLTDQEYESVVGSGDDREDRLQRLDAAVRCIVQPGTAVDHAPISLLRGHAHRFAEKSWLERLKTGEYEEFIIVINEIDEALKV